MVRKRKLMINRIVIDSTKGILGGWQTSFGLLCLMSSQSSFGATLEVTGMTLVVVTINVSVSLLLLYALISLRQGKRFTKDANERFDDLQTQLQDISRQNTRLQRENTTDGLTGIGNRSHFEITYRLEWDRACREKSAIAMLMIDIDLFKRINDCYGHGVGDQCLTAVALAIRGCLHRTSDRLMRYGGEEFAVLLSGSDVDGVKMMANRILRAVRSLEFEQGFQLTVSIGGASLVPDKSKSAQYFMGLVDEALYSAKNLGRNRLELVRDNVLSEVDHQIMSKTAHKVMQK